MNGRLILTLRDLGDGTGQLCAEIQTDKFSGAGSAHFDLQTLHNQARRFSKFPLDAGETVHIEGGYWSKDDPNLLVQEHLYIGVSPTNTRGDVAMRVRLACPNEDSSKLGVRCSVFVELDVHYPELAKFADDLSALAAKKLEKVTVEAGLGEAT